MMDGNLRHTGFHLAASALGQMMPMYLWLDMSACICGAGPTLLKLMGPGARGRCLQEVFDMRRPRSFRAADELIQAQRLRLSLRKRPFTTFKGIAVPLLANEGVLLNLSFGYDVRDAVREHGLSDTDFAPTDLAIELMYLAEAKSAVMAEVSKMAMRLQGAKALAEEQALTDALTGLGNRRAMEKAMALLMRGGKGFALIHLDLDYFKQVNDTLGHAAGDHVLAEVASVLRSSVRGGDLVARIGGDEFVILLAGVRDRAPIARVGAEILAKMRDPILFEGKQCHVGVSMGAVLAPAQPTDPAYTETLLAQADKALYASKNAGRARLTFFAPADRRAGNRPQQPDRPAEDRDLSHERVTGAAVAALADGDDAPKAPDFTDAQSAGTDTAGAPQHPFGANPGPGIAAPPIETAGTVDQPADPDPLAGAADIRVGLALSSKGEHP